jgi:hypothetical protein
MSPHARRLLLALEAVVVAATVLVAWETLAAMLARRTAAFDLEWMEGAVLVLAQRARDGLPLYGTPDADWIPLIYPPLHAWVLGALAHVATLDHALGRTLSLGCTAFATGALVVAARWHGVRWPLALGAAGLFLGCWVDGGAFYDLVRIDALSMALLALALVLGAQPSRAATIGSACALALAFVAKHHAAAFGVPIAWWCWRTHGWRRAALFAACSAVPALAFTVWMQIRTDGAFLRLLLEVPASHGIVAGRALPNLARGRVEGAQAELWRALPLTTTALLALGTSLPRRGYWLAVAGTALVVVSVMRGHVGGYLNVLIPGLWVLSLLAVLVGGGGDPLRNASPLGAQAPVGWRRWRPHLVTALVAAQLVQGRDALARTVPTPADADRAARLVAIVRDMPGPVLSPYAAWLPVQAGHPASPALIALWDIDHAGGPYRAQVRTFEDAVRAHRWGRVLTPDAKLGYGLLDGYTPGPALGVEGPATRTGWPIRLRRVWVPRDDTERP